MFFFPITAQVVSDINLDNCVFQISSNLHEKILKKKKKTSHQNPLPPVVGQHYT